ncbi:MAG TPA: DUF6471 domain-containing protein [Rhizomicrobium sp.]|jgi:hypothetical protein|nr:DUF6471 domain-containing protein [Rhizomicrobium sp.]
MGFHTVVNGENIGYDDFYRWRRYGVTKGSNWQAQAKGLLKGELKRRNVSYADLAAKLGEMGIRETPENIANKISRGGFTAVFLLQCLEAVGCHTIHLSSEK